MAKVDISFERVPSTPDLLHNRHRDLRASG